MTLFLPQPLRAICVLVSVGVLLLSGCSSGPEDSNVTQNVPGGGGAGGGGGGTPTPVGTISDPLFAEQWHELRLFFATVSPTQRPVIDFCDSATFPV